MNLLRLTASLCIFNALVSCITCKKMNVLFLVSDDMRPELGSFLGTDFPSPVHPKIHSPNLDKLASTSLLLKRAYVQQVSSFHLLFNCTWHTDEFYRVQYWKSVPIYAIFFIYSFCSAILCKAVCSPSRTSLLTGRRPDTTHVYDLFTYFREVCLKYIGAHWGWEHSCVMLWCVWSCACILFWLYHFNFLSGFYKKHSKVIHWVLNF